MNINNVNDHKSVVGFTSPVNERNRDAETKEAFGRSVRAVDIQHAVPAGAIWEDTKKSHDKNQNYLLTDYDMSDVFIDSQGYKRAFASHIKSPALEIYEILSSDKKISENSKPTIYSVFKQLSLYVMSEQVLSETKVDLLRRYSKTIHFFLALYTALYYFDEEVDSLLLKLMDIAIFDKHVNKVSAFLLRYTLYGDRVDFKRYDFIVNKLCSQDLRLLKWHILLADANILECGGKGLLRFSPMAAVDKLRQLKRGVWGKLPISASFMDINLRFWGYFSDLIVDKKEFEKSLKLTSDLILSLPIRADDIESVLEGLCLNEKLYEDPKVIYFLNFFSNQKNGYECFKKLRVMMLNASEQKVNPVGFKQYVAEFGGDEMAEMLDWECIVWVLENLLFLDYSFAKKFNDWVVFMTQSPNCDGVEASKNLEELNGYIANSKPRLDRGFHNVPDFIFESMHSEFWVLSGLHSILSEDEDRLTKALHCAHAVAHEDREMSVILKAMFYLCEKDTKSALDVLNNGLQPLQESARLNYFKAELLVLNPSKSKKSNWEKQVIHAYTVAGEKGIIKAFHKLSEFLMKNNSNSPVAWESASKSFGSAVAALHDKNGDFYKHCFVMEELCQIIADKMKDAAPKKPSTTSTKAATESATISVDSQMVSETSALIATEPSSQSTAATQDEVKRKPKKSAQERELQLKRKEQYDEHIDTIRNIWRLIKLVRKGVNSHEDMKIAFEIAEKLILKSSIKPSIRALGHQQKAWCYLTILKHWVDGDTTKLAPNTKASRRKNPNVRPKPLADFPNQPELVQKMNIEIQKGLAVFNITMSELEQCNWENVSAYGADLNEKKQIYSLIDTLGHLNSYLNTRKYQTLYNLSHTLRDRVNSQYSIENCNEAFDS